MKVDFDVLFQCPDDIRPHLERVFAGEYDIKRFGLPEAPRVIDLGANYGAFSVWASHRWPGCTIDAYEPNPKVYGGLLYNLQKYSKVRPHNFGVGEPGKRIFSEGLNNSGEGSFHRATRCDGTPTEVAGQVELEVRSPLELPEADVIKLDIEGCEFEVLSSLIEAGRTFGFILLEYHNEKLRRQIDALLHDYILIEADLPFAYGQGVVKYIHHKVLEGNFA